MDKVCFRTLRDDYGVTTGSPCIGERCIAWSPEVLIDVTDFGDAVCEFRKALESLKSTITIEGNIMKIAAHCHFLELRK